MKSSTSWGYGDIPVARAFSTAASNSNETTGCLCMVSGTQWFSSLAVEPKARLLPQQEAGLPTVGQRSDLSGFSLPPPIEKLLSCSHRCVMVLDLVRA